MTTDFGGKPPLSDWLNARDMLYHNFGVNWACGAKGDILASPENYFMDNEAFWDDMWWSGYFNVEEHCEIHPEAEVCFYTNCEYEADSPYCISEDLCNEEYPEY